MSYSRSQADIEIANRMADAARQAIAPYFRQTIQVDNKLAGGFDPVTAADRASETAMRAVLADLAPEDGILGEEFPDQPSLNGRKWVLDPIDGTRAFIAGLPTWTVLIALSQNGLPRIGMIDQPHIGERFVGWHGGATCSRGAETRPMATRKTGVLADAILATTDAYLFQGEESRAFDGLRQAVRLCRYGYDAYAYAMLAMGGLDLVVESGLQPYDVQALIPVVQGAGGVITNWRGGDCSGGGQVLAAAHPALHAEALNSLRSAAV
ncbi:histidinol-phosphatase [Maricaulis salignorans]|uniref:Histidinol-phosphatase n=1 Tax=Maricaulis salignorans TaxID=144026 RepID=A0A1G9QLX0_9PROT|nr:histidinol-phosphatase [Maricaulis salignorans]SDM12013.1 histidinol-phosphatase, inositol monophosphatase family [Maricaulis salignorans]